MSRDPKILVVDDDPHLREVVRFALEKAGLKSFHAVNGREAVEKYKESQPDLILLDIMMPEIDGTEVCRIIRRESDVPIIFLTSKDDEFDRVLGLELGGDDYIPKPFSPRELVARVKAVLRRLEPRRSPGGTDDPPLTMTVGPLSVNLDRCVANWEDHEVVLTVIELAMLKTLMNHPEKVYSRDELMDRAYDDNTVVSGRTIDSHIRRIRMKFAKIGQDPITTVHGFGYKLSLSK